MEISALQAAATDDPVTRLVLVAIMLLLFGASWMCMRIQSR